MKAYQVPHHEWQGYCERFAQHHRGEPVSLIILDDLSRSAAEERAGENQLPFAEKTVLRDIAFDEKSIEDRPEITVIAGESPNTELRYVIPRPTGIRLEQPEPDGPGRLCIESSPDQQVVIALSRSASPSMLSGLP